MKKLISAVVLLALVLSLAACGAAPSSSATSSPSQISSSAAGAAMPADMPWQDAEPLTERITLNVALLANTLPHLPTYIAQEKGWLGACGIEVNPVVFKNGPSMAEAVGAGAWDCGSTGIGGVITGVLNQDMKVIGVAARDEGGFQAFFARPNSPIVEAGKGHGIIPELYGTADTWRGQEILCAVGTTNQFLLYKTLENFGLTLDDVNVVNMDSSAANTAFLTGQGDVAGVSGPIVFADDKKDFVMVSSDAWAKTGIVTSFVAAPDAWKEKQEAITKWLEVVIMTNEWIEENQEEAAQYLTRMYEEDGYPSTDEANLDLIKNNPLCSLEYETDIITESEDGTMKMKQQTLNALKGYVAMGNYTQEQFESIADSTANFLPDAIEAIAARRSK